MFYCGLYGASHTPISQHSLLYFPILCEACRWSGSDLWQSGKQQQPLLPSIHICVCVCEHVRACVYACVSVCVWSCVCMYVCICAHLCVHVCMHVCVEFSLGRVFTNIHKFRGWDINILWKAMSQPTVDVQNTRCFNVTSTGYHACFCVVCVHPCLCVGICVRVHWDWKAISGAIVQEPFPLFFEAESLTVIQLSPIQ